MSIQEILTSLRVEEKRHSFNVRNFPDKEGIFVGFDSENRACIFVESTERGIEPSIRTSKLQIEFNKEYNLFIDGKGTKNNIFHSIRCLSNDQNDTQIFFTVIDSILADPSMVLKVHSLTSVFYSLVGLFKTGTSPNIAQERQGLWAELFFMKKFKGFNFWAKNWHTDPDKTFDFAYKDKRTEIKSTMRQERVHEFSHKQLFSLSSEDISIVSMMLREENEGISLRNLLEEANLSFKGTPYFIKLELAKIRAGMDNDETGPKYNGVEAEKKVAWLKAEKVPRFDTREPEGVSSTRYKSDLTNAPKMSQEEIDDWLNSFKIDS